MIEIRVYIALHLLRIINAQFIYYFAKSTNFLTRYSSLEELLGINNYRYHRNPRDRKC